MSNQPPRKLGEEPRRPSSSAGSSRPMDAAEAGKSMVIRIGDQVESASEEIGRASASYLYQRSMKGLFTGLDQSFNSTANPFDDVSLSLDRDFFTFPQVEGMEQIQSGSKLNTPKALSGKALL